MLDPSCKGSIATRIGEAEERLRASIAARISRNRAELSRLQDEQHHFEQCLGSASPTRSVGSRLMSPTGYDDRSELAASPRADKEGRPEPAAPAVPKGSSGLTASNASKEIAAALSAAAAACHSSLPEPPRAARTPPTYGMGAAAAAGELPRAAAAAVPPATGGAPGELLLRMTVEIGDGRVGTVEVCQGDTYEALAAAFCREHGLAGKAQALLVRHIAANVGEVLRERAAAEPLPTGSAAASTAASASAASGSPPSSRRQYAAPSTTLPGCTASKPAASASATSCASCACASAAGTRTPSRIPSPPKRATPSAAFAGPVTPRGESSQQSGGGKAVPRSRSFGGKSTRTGAATAAAGSSSSTSVGAAGTTTPASSMAKGRPRPASARGARVGFGGGAASDGEGCGGAFSDGGEMSDGGAMSDGGTLGRHGRNAAARRRERARAAASGGGLDGGGDGDGRPRWSVGTGGGGGGSGVARRERAEALLAAQAQRDRRAGGDFRPEISVRSRRLAEARHGGAGSDVFSRYAACFWVDPSRL